LEVAVSSWKLAWLDCKHHLGFPEAIDDIPGTIHLLRFVWKVIVWKQDTRTLTFGKFALKILIRILPLVYLLHFSTSVSIW